ncbi:B3 domain-containing protein REM14 [Cardamine amara subsp. amara]|uniref:B3 domain-containing protein REM14 n=1 Tax=Cardamine amara subsp. amara TaxID=228776 RepID=A0ABD1AUJ7_CARAN
MADPVLQSPTNPHFFKPILPGFDSHIEIPVTFFLKHLQGRNEHKTAKLRSDASDSVWEVKIDDGWRLTGGWKDFFIAHDFRVGDVIVFRYEGDLVFHVTSMGPSFCEIEYISSHNIDNDSDDLQDNIASETKQMKKREKENPRREEDSSSDHSCFVANVTVSNLYNDKLYLPIRFARSNGWSKKYGKVVLLNEKGRSWKLSLDHDKTGVKTYLRHGWRSFCNANGMNKDQLYTFKLVKNSRTPVIRLCQARSRPDAESSTKHSWFKGSLTPSSLRNDALYLPKEFVSSNGLKEGCEIVLKNESGDTRNLVLKYHKSNEVTVISPGWRSFCQTNGLKVRDFFRFKLVKTGAKHVLCLCAAETNSNTRLVECSEGTGVNSLSTDTSSGEESSETEESEEKKSVKNKGIIVKEESEEESIEDKSSSRECLNKEKWKYCSRTRASSSASQNRFMTLTITPNSVKSNKLRLPLQFTLVNGINKPGKITLLGQDGVTWMVCLVKDNINGRMSIGRDWKGFCEAHGVKIGKSFVLELIWGKDASPVLQFCTRSNSV